MIENLRRAEELGASVPAAHGRHQAAMDKPDRVEGQVQRREGHVGVRDKGLDFGAADRGCVGRLPELVGLSGSDEGPSAPRHQRQHPSVPPWRGQRDVARRL